MAMAEMQEAHLPQEGESVQHLTAVDIDLTPRGLEKFTNRLHRFVRDRNYFFDSPSGKAYSPARIYRMTRDLSIGMMTTDGDIQVIAPELEVRSKRNKDQLFSPQLTARQFAMDGVRLEMINALRNSGMVSTYRASELCGGKDPADALDGHDARYQKWLSGVRQLQAELPMRRAQARQEARRGETHGGTKPTGGEPLLAGAFLAPLAVRYEQPAKAKRVAYVFTSEMVVLSMLLSSCGRTGTATPTEIQIPISTETPFIVPTILRPTETASVLFPYPSEVKNIDLGTDVHIHDQMELLNNYGDYPGQVLGHMLAQLNHEGKIQDNPDTAVLYKEMFQKYDVILHLDKQNDTWVLILRDKATGKYLIPRMTAGAEAGQLRRDLMLPPDYVSQPIGTRFFEFFPVDANNIGADRGSHWTILFTTDASNKPVSWFNADKETTVPVAPEATVTPSATATETAIPVPEYYKGAPTSTKDFTPIATDADEALVTKDATSAPKLDINAKAMFVSLPVKDPGDKYFAFTCNPGINCIQRASISRTIPDVGDLRKTLWEGIINVNGHNKRVFFWTTLQDYEGNEQYENLRYQHEAGAKMLTLDFMYQVDPKIHDEITNPVVWYVLKLLGTRDVANELRQGDDLSDTVLWVVDVQTI